MSPPRAEVMVEKFEGVAAQFALAGSICFARAIAWVLSSISGTGTFAKR